MKRILLADDDRALDPLIRVILKKSDYEIDTVFDGERILSKLNEIDYDVILLDLMMPEVSGMEVLRQLVKRSPATAKRVVVLTAADRKIVETLDTALIGAVLTKPFDVETLRDVVEKIAIHRDGE